MNNDVIVHLLASLGISIPNGTKLPLENLENKLEKALDYAQRYSQLIGNKTLDLRSLSACSSSSLYNAVLQCTVNLGEAMVGSHPGTRRTMQDPFTDLRKVVLGLATEWDNGNRVVVYEDEGRTSAIEITVSPTMHSSNLILTVIHR